MPFESTLESLFQPSDKPFFLAGPCAIEGRDMALRIAEVLKNLSEQYQISLVFKGSYRKANRSRLDSFTGIGDQEALKVLQEVKQQFDLPLITDIHETQEAEVAAEVVDVLQIPAFLFRQTDLLVAAAQTGKVVNIKKGQFAAPSAMKFAVDKVVQSGNERILLTERGTMFGYQDLIVDLRGIPEMKQNGFPVVMDVTHSLQQPNQTAGVTGGRPSLISHVCRTAMAAGAEGVFCETHFDPASALSDGANMLSLSAMEELIKQAIHFRKAFVSAENL